MNFKIFLKSSKIQYHIVKMYINCFCAAYFQILHSSIWRRFTHSGSDAMWRLFIRFLIKLSNSAILMR